MSFHAGSGMCLCRKQWQGQRPRDAGPVIFSPQLLETFNYVGVWEDGESLSPAVLERARALEPIAAALLKD